MANATDNRELLLQNLYDAGCDDSLIDKCMEQYQRKNTQELIGFLREYKHKLLEELHICQKEIDSLDYLIFRLEHGKHEGGIIL